MAETWWDLLLGPIYIASFRTSHKDGVSDERFPINFNYNSIFPLKSSCACILYCITIVTLPV
jgi:hypothetical protein